VLNNTTAVLLFHFVLSAARSGAKTHVTHLNFFRRARFFRQATSLGTSSFGKGPPGPGAGVGVGVGVGVAVDAGVGAGVGVGVGLGVGVRVGYMLHVNCYMLHATFSLRLPSFVFVGLRFPSSPYFNLSPYCDRPMAAQDMQDMQDMRRICQVCRFWVLVLGGCTAFPFVCLSFPSFSFLFLRLLELVGVEHKTQDCKTQDTTAAWPPPGLPLKRQ
jgi:hypothetical protein